MLFLLIINCVLKYNYIFAHNTISLTKKGHGIHKINAYKNSYYIANNHSVRYDFFTYQEERP